MNDLFELAIEELRTQRHDFMNYFQVIFGYIQINKPDKAAEYIKSINTRMLILSRIFNLENQKLGILLQNLVSTLYKLGSEIVFTSEIDCIDNAIFSNNIDEISSGFDLMKLRLENIFEESLSDIVFIKIVGASDAFTIYVSNDQEIVGESQNKHRNYELLRYSDKHSLEFLQSDKQFSFRLNILK